MNSIRPASWLWSVLALTLLALISGCGGSTEQEYSEQEIKTVPDTQVVREWLTSVEQSGQLDSGASVIDEKIDTLDIPNKTELAAEMDKLMGMSGAAQIKAQAKKMLGMLPM